MKTKKDIQQLNVFDYAFFKGVSVLDAKWEFAPIVFGEQYFNDKDEELLKYFTKSGVPRIRKNDYVDKYRLQEEIKSCTVLNGEKDIDTIIDTYNKGLPLQKLRELSQNKTFIKAMRFSGKYSIVNDILNANQLLQLQKSWLMSNCFYAIRLEKNTIEFIKTNDWTWDYLEEKGVSKIRIKLMISEYEGNHQKVA